VTVPTPDGKVQLKIPPGSQSGHKLRLRGRGVLDPKTRARGDLFVRLLVHLPTDGGERVREAVDVLERAYAGDVRSDLRL
jgi:DnaJ-class molecular chaperone